MNLRYAQERKSMTIKSTLRSCALKFSAIAITSYSQCEIEWQIDYFPAHRFILVAKFALEISWTVIRMSVMSWSASAVVTDLKSRLVEVVHGPSQRLDAAAECRNRQAQQRCCENVISWIYIYIYNPVKSNLHVVINNVCRLRGESRTVRGEFHAALRGQVPHKCVSLTK